MNRWKNSFGIAFSFIVTALLMASTSPKWLLLIFFDFGNRKSCKEPDLVNAVVVPAVGCYFWSSTAGCSVSYETEHHYDKGLKTCFSTFLAFLFELLGANVAVFLFTYAG